MKEILFLKILDLLKEATAAKKLSWVRSVEGMRGSVWFTAYLNSSSSESDQKENIFQARFHYYLPSDRSMRDKNWGRVEIFGYWSFTFGVGSLAYYRLWEFIASLFENPGKQWEREKIATENFCRAMKFEHLFETQTDSFLSHSTDLTLLRQILMETQCGNILWRKKAMTDRKRIYATTIPNLSGAAKEIRIKPLCFCMYPRWEHVKTPFLMVLEIPERRIPFIMGTEGYRLLEEIVAAIKGRPMDRNFITNTLPQLRRIHGEDLKLRQLKSNNCASFEQDALFVQFLLEMTQANEIEWYRAKNWTMVGRISLPFSQKSIKLSIKQHWIESATQIGADPLVLELKVYNRSIYAFWGTESGWCLSSLLELLWSRQRGEPDATLNDERIGAEIEKVKKCLGYPF